MSHPEQVAFIQRVKNRFPKAFDGASVLEVGSYNVNGTVRDFFPNTKRYIGLDLAEGKDVDVVCAGKDYSSNELFDVVISTECFEHDPDWYYTFINMKDLCKVGGMVIFTCASYNRQEHGTLRTSPQDSLVASNYYKNLMMDDFIDRCGADEIKKEFNQHAFETEANDLYFWGIKS